MKNIFGRESKIYRVAEEVAELAAELILEVHGHLSEAKICYLFRTDEWTKKGGRYVYGKASKVPEQWRYLSGYDLLVVINQSVWTTLTPERRAALVDHELCHFERIDDAAGNVKSWTLVDHDVEEFIGVVRRHGLWKEDVSELVKAGQQMQIFDGLKVVSK
jgi:hypothetical protein